MTLIYGYSFDQLNIVNIPAAHRYLQKIESFQLREGVLIALFDTDLLKNINHYKRLNREEYSVRFY
jgi:hypothetical protein